MLHRMWMDVQSAHKRRESCRAGRDVVHAKVGSPGVEGYEHDPGHECRRPPRTRSASFWGGGEDTTPKRASTAECRGVNRNLFFLGWGCRLLSTNMEGPAGTLGVLLQQLGRERFEQNEFCLECLECPRTVTERFSCDRWSLCNPFRGVFFPYRSCVCI